MKKVTEKEVYILQIIVYAITFIMFLTVKDDVIRYTVLFLAVAISVILTLFNILVLGKRNERNKKTK